MAKKEREHLCDWGNCENTNVAVSLNYHGEERPTFCCEEHAARWLLNRGRGAVGTTRTAEGSYIEQLEREIDALKHDIERHVAILATRGEF